MSEPPLEGRELQEAVEAFLRSPMLETPAGQTAEPWQPQITDAEEPTVLDVVVEDDPNLRYEFEPDGCFVVVPFSGDQWAVAWELGKSTGDVLLLPERITENVQRGDHVCFIGRWAYVDLHLVLDDSPEPGRMFVIDRLLS